MNTNRAELPSWKQIESFETGDFLLYVNNLLKRVRSQLNSTQTRRFSRTRP